MQTHSIHLFADIMAEAQTYIKKYQDKIIVVKYGGNAMIHDTLKRAVMQDLLLLNQVGIKVVLVHGGGPEISQGLKMMGKESRFINGLRVTDEETIDIVQQMLAGKVNKNLVALLKGKGVGLCGIDGQMLRCEKLKSNPDLGYVGDIQQVNTLLLEFVLQAGFIPVVATIGVDEKGQVYNINADTAASKIAIALKAEKLVNITDTVGVLRDRFDEHSLIPKITLNEALALIAQGTITDGMIPKVQCCVETLQAGVKEVAIIDGRTPHSILIETFTDQGNGTLFYQ